MKVAVIDIGSNSLRLQTSEVKDKSYRVLDDYKEMIRLGDAIYTLGYFPKEVMDQLVDLLNDMKKLAESRGCETIRAVATAAFRESDNMAETLIRVEQDCGIRIEVINGEEEARLTYLAATANFELSTRKALVMDIGGGSTEYTVINRGKMEKSASLPLGCNRLTREFLFDDPPRAKQLLDMKEHIFDMQEGFGLDREIDMVICTGGSMNNVAYIKHYGNKEMRDSAVKYVERRFLKKLIFDMRGKSVKERVRSISGLEEKRGDIVLSAAMQTDMALQATATNGFYALSGGLRAGLTIDTINKKGIELPFQNNMENIRYSRLIEVGNKFDFDEETAVQVGKIAEKLFAGLEKELSLNTRDWYILEAASVLHDIGKHISYSKHHKHSYYLIRNSELVGYSFEEVEMIAQVARYHRKNPPKQSHEEYQALEEGMREKVDKLAGILRVAISLDRSHKGYINDLRVKIEDSQISIMPLTDDDISMERKDFERKKELLEKILGKPVKLV